MDNAHHASWRPLDSSQLTTLAAAAMAPALATVLALGWRPAGHALVALSCLPLCAVMLALAARATRHALWIEIENALPSLSRRLRWRNRTR